MTKGNDPSSADVPANGQEIIFDPADRAGSSSEVSVSVDVYDAERPAALTSPAPEFASPIFKELASAELPPLERENRARLLMQSPNRLFFYWSLNRDPRHTLTRLFGTSGAESYTLVIKLLNLTRDDEHLDRAEAEGTWWFDVDSNSTYRAEVGLYAAEPAVYSPALLEHGHHAAEKTKSAGRCRIGLDRHG